MYLVRLLVLGIFSIGLLQAAELPEATKALPATPWADTQPLLYGILNISRMDLQSGCDIDLYVQDQKVARLQPLAEVSLNLPPGKLSVRVQIAGGGPCQAGIEPLRGQSLDLAAGQVKRLRIISDQGGLNLLPN